MLKLLDINLTTKINKVETYIKNYNIYLYVLKRLYVQLNKDGTYPYNPYPKLSILEANLMESHTKTYGYKWFSLVDGERTYQVCINKYDGDVHISCKETTKGAYIDCGGFSLSLSCLDTQDYFNQEIKARIDLYEKNRDEDIQRIGDLKKVWKQLKKINAYSLDNWEVKDLL